jgi:hypothetical protein
MKKITFSDSELEFILRMYQAELTEAEEYLENIKNILRKIDAPETEIIAQPLEKKPARRGRKPRSVEKSIPPATKPVVKKRRRRSDKGKKRIKKGQPAVQELVMSETERDFLRKKESSPSAGSKKPVIRRRRKTKSKGVILAPMHK